MRSKKNYNKKRIHSSLGFKTPHEFLEEWMERGRINARAVKNN
jgi:transposase InsO family protein